MLWLLLLAWMVPAQSGARVPIDVSRIQVGTPVVVTVIDTGRLKGDVRRLAWSVDSTSLYLQTAEGNPPLETAHHYLVELAGGLVSPIASEPDWALRYWEMKQDKVAPGMPSLEIQVAQGKENIKTGTGPAGALDRSSSPDSALAAGPNIVDLANANMGTDRARVVRLSLLGHDIATWRNERVIPGLRFGWGPSGSGALVYVGDKGELVFFDQSRHRVVASAVKDAVLPAWSADGGRVAYLQKTGRKKYAVAWVPVGW